MKFRQLAVLFALVWAPACETPGHAADNHKEAVARPRPATVKLEARRVPKTLSYVGTLVAPRDATLSSTRGGRVDAYTFEVGQVVKRNDVLVKLGAAELSYASQAALASAVQARARIGQAKDAASMSSSLAAKAALELAVDGARRAEQLFKQGSLSEQELSRRRSNLASAQAQYEGALAGAEAELAMVKQYEAASAQATAALDDKTIRAPFDGVVLDRFIDVGQIAAPHAPLLRVIDASELRVRFDLPQFDADKVKLGGRASVRIGERMLPAVVVRSTPGLVGLANARLVEAKITLPPELEPGLSAQLLPGAHVPVWLEIEGADDVVVVPLSATLSTAGLLRAWVVRDNHLNERLLSVLRYDGAEVLVRDGLAPGELLVSAPASDFRIGEEVMP
jgi:membrane fusion protein (multidrug efflux system)